VLLLDGVIFGADNLNEIRAENLLHGHLSRQLSRVVGDTHGDERGWKIHGGDQGQIFDRLRVSLCLSSQPTQRNVLPPSLQSERPQVSEILLPPLMIAEVKGF
jgi:hypothetical protein